MTTRNATVKPGWIKLLPWGADSDLIKRQFLVEWQLFSC
jgi:hypothetical protein